jgi:L-malate glycosyltransferase
MKILVIIYEFPPIGGGGGRAAYDICIELAKRGYEITVLTAHMQGLPKQEEIKGIHILRIPALRKEAFRASFVTMLAYVVCGFWAGLRHIKNNRPNMIHSHFAVPSGALAWMLSVLTNIPYILTAHLGDVPGGVPDKTDTWFRWLKPFTVPIWQRAKTVVAVSEYTRSLAIKHYPLQIKVIPNGATLHHSESIKIKINQPVQIVFAGRFMPQKNPLLIVHVLSQLKDLNWHCTMLGDGPLFESTKGLIQEQQLQNKFTLSGWVTPQDVMNQFSQSDILFMTSRSEGLPVVGVQALTYGLAFIVSDIGGFVDLVDNEKNGFLIPVNDVDRFVKVLGNLLTNPEQLHKFRISSLEKAKQFDIHAVANEYEKLLRL